MRESIGLFRGWFLVFAFVLGFCVFAEAAPDAIEILETAGVKGGIVVHIGCGDGRLTVGLFANNSFIVHGLDDDAGNVAKARAYAPSMGLYGKVSFEHWESARLPYADNLVNLVVSEDLGAVTMEEVVRVLRPLGVAYIKAGGEWKKTIKPWPDNIDEWSHYLHDASNNAVADDTVVAHPRNLQWVAPPLWLRSHETPSGIQSPVSAGGRLFYYFDEGLIGITDERLPDRWSLVCRDAFNGMLLWKQPLEAWGWREWSPGKWEGKDWTALRAGRTDVPNENQRRIVAEGERLYTTLDYDGAMSILDAATGNVIKTVEETAGASEILVSDGIVVVYTKKKGEGKAALVAVDGTTGNVVWKKEIGVIRPLALAIDNGLIVHLSGKELVGRNLKDGGKIWGVVPKPASPKTIVIADGVVVMQGGKLASAYDGGNGKLLWSKNVPPIGGGEGDDLFVIDGLVWRGMLSVDVDGKVVGKSANSLMIGWDLRTGAEKKRIQVNNLRSPEHHHRCYRNKATVRYMISSYEGAEFLDFQGGDHGQHNWLRGACRNGMMPCNGMLYVPPDQCFCQPGGKLLGYTAVKAAPAKPVEAVADAKRLIKGPAYGKVAGGKATTASDWPTYRHDAARSGTTRCDVNANATIQWTTKLGGTLSQPVAAGGKVFVAKTDAHTLYAMDAKNGKVVWEFITNGRIDSAPTIYGGMVLLGCRDGYVYCLRAADGAIVWRFLAAVADERIASFDQVESVWPVHGSILVDNSIAYFTAGRSTYLDGGIRAYGLEPATGRIIHRGLLDGPHMDVDGERDLAFFILGANSDVLVSEGGYLYMRQKKMTPDLKEIDIDVLSSKGAQDVGLHIFSTAGLLDSSWYNRTFWMYSKRWPGFQLANQAPKTGQLLVVDDEKTYAVRAFYRRNVHSTMFFPGKEGYLLFADLNTNEPQIVGEEGAVKPVEWLPQSDFSRARGNEMRALDSEAFGLDKMIGYTRAKPPVWSDWLPVRIQAMVKAGDVLFVAGAPDEFDAEDPYAAFESRKGAVMVAVSADNGKKLSQTQLKSPPVFDGMIAADGRLFASLSDGTVVCMGEK